jgi:hypothetical protein
MGQVTISCILCILNLVIYMWKSRVSSVRQQPPPCPLTIPARPRLLERVRLIKAWPVISWESFKFFLVKPVLVQDVQHRFSKVAAVTRYLKFVSLASPRTSRGITLTVHDIIFLQHSTKIQIANVASSNDKIVNTCSTGEQRRQGRGCMYSTVLYFTATDYIPMVDILKILNFSIPFCILI